MNTKRLLIGASTLLSGGVFLYAAHPRIAVWTDTSNSNLIAEQRAATCAVARLPVALGQSIDLNPGKYVCHWNGSTGQVGNDRRIIHIKNGQPENISNILTQRGFKQ
jgi:hypothetical protein